MAFIVDLLVYISSIALLFDEYMSLIHADVVTLVGWKRCMRINPLFSLPVPLNCHGVITSHFQPSWFLVTWSAQRKTESWVCPPHMCCTFHYLTEKIGARRKALKQPWLTHQAWCWFPAAVTAEDPSVVNSDWMPPKSSMRVAKRGTRRDKT